MQQCSRVCSEEAVHMTTAADFNQTWGVYGHDWAVDQLRRSLLHDRIRHAYLVLGAEGVGKETLARGLAMALNCLEDDGSRRPCGVCRICRQIQSGNHADVLYSQVDATSGLLRIEELRTMTGRIALKPYDARFRIAIFRDFDRAQARAQDALLKTLEEPPPHAVLVLLAQAQESILPTIISRSQLIHLRPVRFDTLKAALMAHAGIDAELAALLAGLSGGRMGWALQALEDGKILEARSEALTLLESLLGKNRAGRFATAEELAKEKLSLTSLLELWQSYWRDLLHMCGGSGLPPVNVDHAAALARLASMITLDDALRALRATQTLLQALSTNANARLAMEIMFLDYPGLEHA
jgi:DNA polymerase-3 subunit delta'